MPPFRHHHRHHRHHGPPLGALLVGGMVGAAVSPHHRHPPPPPRYYRGRPYREVIIVTQPPPGIGPMGPNEFLVRIICPSGIRPGDQLEIEVEGQGYHVTLPNVHEGQSFYARIKRKQQHFPVAEITSVTPTNNSNIQQNQQIYQAETINSNSFPTNQQAAEGSTTTLNEKSVPTANIVPSSTAPQAQAQVVGIDGPIIPIDEAVAQQTATPAIPSISTQVPSSYSSNNPFLDEPIDDTWVITPDLKESYDAFFIACGASMKNGKMVMTPTQVRDALLPTGLSKEILRNIWELSDIDKDGQLDIDEFAVAMYLCQESHKGITIPSQLPQNVIPPCKRNPF